MTKRISISPQTMIAIVGGAKLRPVNIPAVKDAIIVKCAYDSQSQQFEVEIKSDSFENPASEQRLPQTFILDVQK
jgi:hypothetical protein